MYFTGEDNTEKAKPRKARDAVRAKLAITQGIMKMPVKIASAGFIALYFLNLKASFNKFDIFVKKFVWKRFKPDICT